MLLAKGLETSSAWRNIDVVCTSVPCAPFVNAVPARATELLLIFFGLVPCVLKCVTLLADILYTQWENTFAHWVFVFCQLVGLALLMAFHRWLKHGFLLNIENLEQYVTFSFFYCYMYIYAQFI